MIEHSPKFEHIKQLFIDHQWDLLWVRNAVVKGWITPEEYFEITEEDYPDPNN